MLSWAILSICLRVATPFKQLLLSLSVPNQILIWLQSQKLLWAWRYAQMPGLLSSKSHNWRYNISIFSNDLGSKIQILCFNIWSFSTRHSTLFDLLNNNSIWENPLKLVLPAANMSTLLNFKITPFKNFFSSFSTTLHH